MKFIMLIMILAVLVRVLNANKQVIPMAGSVGDSYEADHFPLFGANVISIPNSDASYPPTLYVTDKKFCVVREIIGKQSRVVAGIGFCSIKDPDNHNPTPSKETPLYSPSGMYYDSTQKLIYIADKVCVRLLDLEEKTISIMDITFNGLVWKQFSEAKAITMNNGDLYVSDMVAGVVFKIKLSSRNVGVATIFAGLFGQNNVQCSNGVMARSCSLSSPSSLSFLPNGVVAIPDHNRILFVDQGGYLTLTTVPEALTSISQIMVYQESKMLISDSGMKRFLLLDMGKKELETKLVLDNSVSSNTMFSVIVNQVNNFKDVYFLTNNDPDTSRNQMDKFKFVETNLPIKGTETIYGLPFSLDNPISSTSIYMTSIQQMRLSSDNQLYFPIFGSAIVKLDINSGFVTRIAGLIGSLGYNQDNILATKATLNQPQTVLVLESGEIVFSDSSNNRIRKIDSKGFISTIVGTGTPGDCNENTLAVKCDINSPAGLSAPPPMKAAEFLFAFADNHKVKRLNHDLTVTTIVSQNLVDPNGIFYASNGELFIADSGRNQIVKFSNNEITVVAGVGGQQSYSGDGGPATKAGFGLVTDVALSSNGEIYIADYGNNALRKVSLDGIINTVIANPNYIGPQLYGFALTKNDEILFSDGYKINMFLQNQKACHIFNGTCSNHGSCSKDTCACESGWMGNGVCTQFTCDGVNKCQPNGQCVGSNTCKCNEGYGGVDCNCLTNYFGDKCQWIDCDPSSNDQSETSPKRCSSHGKCKLVDGKSPVCECDFGFDGQYCQNQSDNKNIIPIVIGVSSAVAVLTCAICLISLVCCLVVFIKKRGRNSEKQHLLN